MSEARAKLPRWAQRPGESFADYLDRYHDEIETPQSQSRACGEELAWMERELGPPSDVVDAPADAPER